MKVKIGKSLELSMLSKFRTELMGYAIIGVLIVHFMQYTGCEIKPINFIARLVYTQGFLFLSGFGLYFSYSKNSQIVHFYKKRVRRLYVPFVLISFPFLVLHVFINKENVWDFLGYITTLHFWLNGNYYGMWYVAVSLVLYILYPFIHKFLFSKTKNILLRGGYFILVMFILFALIYIYCPNYWELVGIWVVKSPMFLLGMIAGYYASISCKVSLQQFMIYIIVLALLLVTTRSIGFIYGILRVLIGMPLICMCFSVINEKKCVWIHSLFRWLGKYSLEIYLLHLFIYWSWHNMYAMDETLRYIITIVVTLILCERVHLLIDRIQNK